MNTLVVVFTDNNARIIRNPEDLEKYKSMDNAIINPDLKAVEFIPPHLWKQDNDKIIPMTKEESELRREHIHLNGALNDVNAPRLIRTHRRHAKPGNTIEMPVKKRSITVPSSILYMLMGSILTYLLMRVV